MLDLAVDPKLAWALANRGRFHVDVNRAEREMLLRIPGLEGQDGGQADRVPPAEARDAGGPGAASPAGEAGSAVICGD